MNNNYTFSMRAKALKEITDNSTDSNKKDNKGCKILKGN